jgi:hypothetical protein
MSFVVSLASCWGAGDDPPAVVRELCMSTFPTGSSNGKSLCLKDAGAQSAALTLDITRGDRGSKPDRGDEESCEYAAPEEYALYGPTDSPLLHAKGSARHSPISVVPGGGGEG